MTWRRVEIAISLAWAATASLNATLVWALQGHAAARENIFKAAVTCSLAALFLRSTNEDATP